MSKTILRMKDYFDKWSLVIILVTVVLFVVALFVKGLTKDLLLEIGILLVSIKLIMGSYKNSQNDKQLNEKLDEIRGLVKEKA